MLIYFFPPFLIQIPSSFFFFADRVLKAYPKTGITGYDFSDGWKPKGGQLDSQFPETELDILIFDVEAQLNDGCIDTFANWYIAGNRS